MLVVIETGQSWDPSEPINGVRYPLNVALLWSDDDLAAIGLARPAPPASVDLEQTEDQ